MNIRKTARLAFAVAMFLGMPTQSNARTIDPEQNAICAAMAQPIVTALGATITDRTDTMYFLAIGDFKDIHFICDRTNSLRQFDGIDISYNDEGDPPESWWTILGLAGAAYSGRTKADVVELARSCLAEAAADALGQITSNQIHIVCSTGQPGTRIYIRIFPEQEN